MADRTTRWPLLGVLTLLLVTLKLTEVIDWSWWWVLAPTWIPVAGVVDPKSEDEEHTV